MFVLCDSHGFAYRFEVYNGAGDNVVLPGAPDLGTTANIVVRLCQTVPDFVHHVVYFDNLYTSLPLLVYLRARGIYCLGTIRSNRIPNCKFPSDAVVNKKERGYSVEYVGKAYGIDINTVLWKDNKSVRLASTYVGIESFATANPDQQRAKAARFDRKEKKFIEVDCPQIVREYNLHMGGVDLMDGLMGRYHIRAKTRDAMMKLFHHLLDLSATNAYILYRRTNAENVSNRKSIARVLYLVQQNMILFMLQAAFKAAEHAKKVLEASKEAEEQNKPPEVFSSPEHEDALLQLPQFREEIAAMLVAYAEKRPVGRPSKSEVTKPKKTNVSKTVHPIDDNRYDGIGHMPLWKDRTTGKKSCKHCKKSETQCMCSKCNLHLCCSSAKNCFVDYHTK